VTRRKRAISPPPHKATGRQWASVPRGGLAQAAEGKGPGAGPPWRAEQEPCSYRAACPTLHATWHDAQGSTRPAARTHATGPACSLRLHVHRCITQAKGTRKRASSRYAIKASERRFRDEAKPRQPAGRAAGGGRAGRMESGAGIGRAGPSMHEHEGAAGRPAGGLGEGGRGMGDGGQVVWVGRKRRSGQEPADGAICDIFRTGPEAANANVVCDASGCKRQPARQQARAYADQAQPWPNKARLTPSGRVNLA
jgi:hypothetical protein